MSYSEIEDILEYDNDIYILYRHNVVELLNLIKAKKSEQAYNDLIDYYEL
jgi:hypothetical protein